MGSSTDIQRKQKEKREETKFRKKLLDLVVLYSLEHWTF